MKKFHFLAVILLAMTTQVQIVQAQCTAQTEFTENFESYEAGTGEPMPPCWSSNDTKARGVRNKEGDAHLGSKYNYIYTMFDFNSVNYFITPEISTIDGEHFAEFWMKASRDNVTIEYGTMSDNTNLSTFVSVGSGNLSTSYQKITSGKITQTGHKYFAIKVTAPSWHTAIYLDDFSWKKDIPSSVKQTKGKNLFSYYNNSSSLIIDAKEMVKKVIIYNMSGQKVHSSITNNNNVNIDINNLSQGIYLVKTLIGNTTQTFKMIKK